MVNFSAIRATFDILAGDQVYSNPDDASYKRYVDRMYERFQNPSEMANIEGVVEQYRSQIGGTSGRDCRSFHAINDQLLPNVKALSDKGVRVDIVVPTFSYAFYYIRRNDISPTLLDEQMVARRCLVDAASDLPHVSIFAFDDDPAVAGDLGNFREVGHIYNPVILRNFFVAIATGSHRLTRKNFPGYESAIRTAVENYNPTNSYLDPVSASPNLEHASSPSRSS